MSKVPKAIASPHGLTSTAFLTCHNPPCHGITTECTLWSSSSISHSTGPRKAAKLLHIRLNFGCKLNYWSLTGDTYCKLSNLLQERLNAGCFLIAISGPHTCIAPCTIWHRTNATAGRLPDTFPITWITKNCSISSSAVSRSCNRFAPSRRIHYKLPCLAPKQAPRAHITPCTGQPGAS